MCPNLYPHGLHAELRGPPPSHPPSLFISLSVSVSPSHVFSFSLPPPSLSLSHTYTLTNSNGVQTHELECGASRDANQNAHGLFKHHNTCVVKNRPNFHCNYRIRNYTSTRIYIYVCTRGHVVKNRTDFCCNCRIRTCTSTRIYVGIYLK